MQIGLIEHKDPVGLATIGYTLITGINLIYTRIGLSKCYRPNASAYKLVIWPYTFARAGITSYSSTCFGYFISVVKNDL